MGIPEERVEDPAEYICCICQDVYEDPLRSNCGHIFCRVCISSYMSAVARHRHNQQLELMAMGLVEALPPVNTQCPCPMDRCPIYSLTPPDEEYLTMYRSLRVFCKHYPYCDDYLTVETYQSHDKSCDKSEENFLSGFL